jgi:hypothetical protein
LEQLLRQPGRDGKGEQLHVKVIHNVVKTNDNNNDQYAFAGATE